MLFLTGGTGFLGGALVTKFRGNFPNEQLALLVRADTYAQGKERILEACPILRKSYEEKDIFKNITPILGDLMKPDLGLSQSDQDLLINTCKHVYHSGANTNLAIDYNESKLYNLEGTRRVLELADQISEISPDLVFNQISTAYVAGDTNQTICSNFLDLKSKFRNGYEQTKAESEALVLSRKNKYHVRIYRPSVIVGDSITGRTSAFNVLYIPTRIICAGLLKVIPALPYAPFDIVPVNYVVDAITKAHNLDLASGSTFHLTAGLGRESNPNEIIDILFSTLSTHGSLKKLIRPTFVPPELLLKTMQSVGNIANNIYNTPTFRHIEKLVGAHLPVLGQVLPLIPYMISNPRFDNSSTESILGIPQAPKFQDYGERIFRYCLDSKWGKITPRYC